MTIECPRGPALGRRAASDGAAPRRVVIASPIEPSGASWVLNVLLELGVRVHHRPVEHNVFRSAPRSMWVEGDDGRARLHPSCSQIEKWMPALLLHDGFAFRTDVEIDYTQELPPKGGVGDAELVFLRDPRDAILSAYKRAAPGLDYEAWLALPNSRTLLDRAANWALYARTWLARPSVAIARFEDYKTDDRATFDAVAEALGLAFAGGDVERAVAASTFEKAREGEALYRAAHPEDTQIANRAGRVGEARSTPELEQAARFVEARAADVIAELGYPKGAPLGPPTGAAPLRWLRRFGDVDLAPVDEATRATDPLRDPSLPGLLAFARDVDAATLANAGVSAPEGRDLVDALAELAFAHARATAVDRGDPGSALGDALTARLVGLRAELADGSRFQLAGLRALVARRRRAKATSGRS